MTVNQQKTDWSTYQPEKSVAGVLRFLQSMGLPVSKSTLYDHCRDGLLKKNRAGVYPLAAVKRYARAHWLPTDAPATVEDEEEGSLLASKTREEIKRIRAERRLKEMKLEVETGKYIRIDDAYAQLAGRFLVLDSGLDYMIQTRAAEFIALVGGSQDRQSDLVAAMTTAKNELMASYAGGEFVVEE